MTEAEWLTCSDPKPMLEFLRGQVSERKLRLFGVAICRQLQVALNIPAIAETLESTERYAKTQKTKAELKRGRQGVRTIRHAIPNGDKTRFVEWSALWLTEVVATENAFGGVGDELIRLTASGLVASAAPVSLMSLLHDIFGNPFNPVAIDRLWLTRNVTILAQLIYEHRAFGRMPELADALENAGCTNSDILEHCRGPGPHVRGCWVIDRVLGKA